MVLQVFVWSPHFETGVELIDSQHRVLVELTNALGDAVVHDERAQCLQVLEQLKAYADYHFKAEEAWSIEAGQPPQALAAHHKGHAGFVHQLAQFTEGWCGDGQKAQALHRFLTAWLITHILGEDRNMVMRLSQQSGSLIDTPVALGVGEQVLLEAAHNLHAALSGKSLELEQRVQARTAELAESNQQLKANLLTGVRTFTSLIELRGGMLAGHSRRVADLARQLAMGLKLDAETVQQVFLGALLHDIGKIGLPDDLLGKPVARMTAQELKGYRAHPVNGEGALIAMAELHGASQAVRSHHERWDGQGYPDGLAGEGIPLPARIVAVANDFDNLQHGITTARRLSMDEALRIIQASRNERYDPTVVDALTVMLGRSADADEPEVATSCTALLPGMMLTRDLVTPEGVLLLTAHTALEAQTVARVRHFMAAGGLTAFPVYVRSTKGHEG
ncbi:bacteriohemerythrin [Hydrogenophaga sp. PAMC20947]|uniref:bacteriohemerythrin n=1 Tax=Hydrogenophaga sp. PAMC20947 TaxID=2565558 RepID=UPI0014479437|nr:bacteriohemerythrin [Hydrogenophaga sp. PAMC20947]